MNKQVSSRETALKIIYEVEKNGAYVNLALKNYLKEAYYETVDKKFITELVYGVIKYKLTIDYIIEQFSSLKMNKISDWILNILRLGVYQIIYLDKVPNAAACNESVKLAKRYGHQASAKFVNAVLRNISKSKNNIRYPDKKMEPLRFLSINYSHPLWMVEKWVKKYGFQFTEELCRANNQIAGLVVRVNTLKTTREELIYSLASENVEAQKGKYSSDALILNHTGNIEALKSFKDGLFQVQDESSMLVSNVLDARPGEFVIDACCAPGGKTTHIAQIMKNSGQILGWDIHAHKIELVRETAKRLGMGIIESELHDATIKYEQYIAKADRVLVDAPCSGLGIIRKKPDIKWNKVNDHLEDLVALQKKILEVSSEYVKPGGTLVYSTCTIQDEENIGVVKEFIEHHPEFIFQDIGCYLPGNLKKEKLSYGYVQLFPHIDDTDGFFICRMQRQY